MVRNVTTKRVQADEIWSVIGAKEKNPAPAKEVALGWGDCWTWTAIDADPKLCLAWMIGRRDSTCAKMFMRDVADRLANRVQLAPQPPWHPPRYLPITVTRDGIQMVCNRQLLLRSASRTCILPMRSDVAPRSGGRGPRCSCPNPGVPVANAFGLREPTSETRTSKSLVQAILWFLHRCNPKSKFRTVA